TGKTVVAACAIAAAADTGKQACMMAPTSVLAQQYATKLGPLFDRAQIPWAVLTGATTPSERERILRDLANGTIAVLFGTHAVLQDDVVFSDLSLVIIDEQHRFGVDQRAALRAKGPGSDLLLMTATPIPRSLALMLYGDLDCSYIRSRPFSMARTTTRLVKKSNRAVAYEAIRKAVAEGRQAYIVCPLVGVKIPEQEDDGFDHELEENIENSVDVADVKAAEQEARFLATKVFPEARVGLLTGPMPSNDKAKMMDRFRKGAIDILVSTTVIEVGVDVPNATVMMVEDAERFGLSQLHQLRGRISRGKHSGELYLVASPGSDESKQRLSALAKTDDGFELAEYDLRLRKEGDILGSRQHGIPSLRLINVIRDAKLIRDAHEDASLLLAEDPLLKHPENGPLALEMERVFARTEDVGGIA
ncbi:MAG: DEAD/DEAH box helicase, partial [Actinobacteria bacterium]|nr:DEAD/DEAH box helicase [Actinomycetota bacterium]